MSGLRCECGQTPDPGVCNGCAIGGGLAGHCRCVEQCSNHVPCTRLTPAAPVPQGVGDTEALTLAEAIHDAMRTCFRHSREGIEYTGRPDCEVFAAGLAPWLATRDAALRAEALREAASYWENAVIGNTNAIDLEVKDRVVGWLRERADRIIRQEPALRESVDALPVRGDGDLADPATYNAAIDAQIASIADLPHDEQVEALAMRYVTLQRVYRELRADRIAGGAL